MSWKQESLWIITKDTVTGICYGREDSNFGILEGRVIITPFELSKTNKEMKKYYEAMIERMEEGKPEDWDGTYRATSK
jgi:hypothetical protein